MYLYTAHRAKSAFHMAKATLSIKNNPQSKRTFPTFSGQGYSYTHAQLREQSDYILHWPSMAIFTLKHNSGSKAYISYRPRLYTQTNSQSKQTTFYTGHEEPLLHSNTTHRARRTFYTYHNCHFYTTHIANRGYISYCQEPLLYTHTQHTQQSISLYKYICKQFHIHYCTIKYTCNMLWRKAALILLMFTNQCKNTKISSAFSSCSLYYSDKWIHRLTVKAILL